MGLNAAHLKQCQVQHRKLPVHVLPGHGLPAPVELRSSYNLGLCLIAEQASKAKLPAAWPPRNHNRGAASQPAFVTMHACFCGISSAVLLGFVPAAHELAVEAEEHCSSLFDDISRKYA